MPIRIKIEYRDEIVVVEEGIRAEEKQGSLLVYDKDGNVAGRFQSSKVEHWWSGTTENPDRF